MFWSVLQDRGQVRRSWNDSENSQPFAPSRDQMCEIYPLADTLQSSPACCDHGWSCQVCDGSRCTQSAVFAAVCCTVLRAGSCTCLAAGQRIFSSAGGGSKGACWHRRSVAPVIPAILALKYQQPCLYVATAAASIYERTHARYTAQCCTTSPALPCMDAYPHAYSFGFMHSYCTLNTHDRIAHAHAHAIHQYRSHINFFTYFTIRTSRALAQSSFSSRCLRFL